MKPHYFNQDKADQDDILLQMCISQGYVPKGCLLGGQATMGLTRGGRNPCVGCEGPREKCGGKKNENPTS